MIPRRCRCRQHRGARWSWRTRSVGGKFICDDCYLLNDNLFLWSSWWDRHPVASNLIVSIATLYIAGGAICFTIAMLRIK